MISLLFLSVPPNTHIWIEQQVMMAIILPAFSIWYWLQNLTAHSIHKEWTVPGCVSSSTFPPPLNSFAHSFRNTAVLWLCYRPPPDSFPFVLFMVEQSSSDSVLQRKRSTFSQELLHKQPLCLQKRKRKKKNECRLNGILLCTKLSLILNGIFFWRMSFKGNYIHAAIKWWTVHTWIFPTYWGKCTWSAFWLRMGESQESILGKIKA